jgi:hypothetical protein
MNTPWGNIARGYRCIIYSDGTELQQKIGNIHAGGSAFIGARQQLKWTYKNTYETAIPGKGNVKVFAGRFDYQITPLFPGISFPGNGTGSVKAYLDPDNGRWTVTDREKHDPPIVFDATPSTAVQPPVANANANSNPTVGAQQLNQMGVSPQQAAYRQALPPGTPKSKVCATLGVGRMPRSLSDFIRDCESAWEHAPNSRCENDTMPCGNQCIDPNSHGRTANPVCVNGQMEWN